MWDGGDGGAPAPSRSPVPTTSRRHLPTLLSPPPCPPNFQFSGLKKRGSLGKTPPPAPPPPPRQVMVNREPLDLGPYVDVGPYRVTRAVLASAYALLQVRMLRVPALRRCSGQPQTCRDPVSPVTCRPSGSGSGCHQVRAGYPLRAGCGARSPAGRAGLRYALLQARPRCRPRCRPGGLGGPRAALCSCSGCAPAALLDHSLLYVMLCYYGSHRGEGGGGGG